RRPVLVDARRERVFVWCAGGGVAHAAAPALGELDVRRRPPVLQPPAFLRKHTIRKAGCVTERAQLEREGGQLGPPEWQAGARRAALRCARGVAVQCDGGARHSSTAIITSVDLTIALTLAPFFRPRLETELSVITETISSPPASRKTTSAVT